jgi:hypothetical protein
MEEIGDGEGLLRAAIVWQKWGEERGYQKLALAYRKW